MHWADSNAEVGWGRWSSNVARDQRAVSSEHHSVVVDLPYDYMAGGVKASFSYTGEFMEGESTKLETVEVHLQS